MADNDNRDETRESYKIRSAGGLFGPSFQHQLGASPTLRAVYLASWHRGPPTLLGLLVTLCELLDKLARVGGPGRPVTEAVDKIIRDMSGRSGLDHAWDDIDEETQAEIRSTWCDIVAQVTHG